MIISLQDAINLLNIIIEPIFPDLASHMQRTTYISLSLARALELPEERVRNVYLAASIHDIGLLAKKQREITADNLSNENLMFHHEEIGEAMVAGISFPPEVQSMIRHHHIHWNSQYPDEYPLDNHIIHMADEFDLYLRKCPKDFIVNADEIINVFLMAHSDYPPELIVTLRKLSQRDAFWFRLESQRLHSVLKRITPVANMLMGSQDFLEFCLLISRIVDKYSSFTMTHSTSVSNVSCKIANLMGFSLHDQTEIAIAGYLHDIGKVHIPLAVLEKEGRLTDNEYALIRKHSYKTLEILALIKPLKRITPWAVNHHERLDGGGYPFGLTARDLDLPSRIMAVADVFTALTENRPYRQGMAAQKALTILEEEVAGNKLDGDVVDIVKRHLDDVYQCVLRV
ncbi:HD domain-containing protein [Enterobacteriaceae bacterium BIT-l23]|uniref:HD-GYP domain-containing protein n=1 Tax=Jejubacter sp. L23 TaxID=3092086 RepID=UPI0015848ABF|nr:HD domain-containing protein [Enterobacteriaceae bacterium BIT-l23]